jgi:RimJ/RimL family protein N-acetyltransferase
MNSSLVSLRDLARTDIPQILSYWYESPAEYIEAMGVDLTKLSPRADFERALTNKCIESETAAKSNINALVIEYMGKAIGFHTINPVKPCDSGVFHAHIWNSEMRGRGLGMQTYPKACRTFFERFDLQRILFKTPIQNVGAIRIKEKLGIPCIGEEIIEFGVYKTGTRSKVFELTRAHFDNSSIVGVERTIL